MSPQSQIAELSAENAELRKPLSSTPEWELWAKAGCRKQASAGLGAARRRAWARPTPQQGKAEGSDDEYVPEGETKSEEKEEEEEEEDHESDGDDAGKLGRPFGCLSCSTFSQHAHWPDCCRRLLAAARQARQSRHGWQQAVRSREGSCQALNDSAPCRSRRRRATA